MCAHGCSTASAQFQYLMVQLKDLMNNTNGDFPIFQYLMVQLKDRLTVVEAVCAVFQYLMVQLKVQAKHEVQKTIRNFNTSWYN